MVFPPILSLAATDTFIINPEIDSEQTKKLLFRVKFLNTLFQDVIIAIRAKDSDFAEIITQTNITSIRMKEKN
jgi:hypothetical protein